MTFRSHLIATACSAFLAIAMPQVSKADELTAGQKGEVERILRDYLIAHPEIIQDAMAELDKRQSAADAEKHKTTIKQSAQTIFSSPRQVVLGNPDGNVTFVEFFDYNCGYCKRAMDDMLTLLKDDPKLKVVLKEFPVLGPGSVEAAQVAVAVRMQDKTGKKYLEFHQKLLGGRGPGRQGSRTCGGQGHRPRHGSPRKGSRERRSEGDPSGKLQARRVPRSQRHAKLCDRRQCRRRCRRSRRAERKDQYLALRQADLLTDIIGP